MSKIQIFEPAMCCQSGVCGPNVNPQLLRITTVVNNLKNEGILVDRFNLSSNPQVFASNTKIREALQKEGMKVLPITTLNDVIIKKGEYLTNEEFAKFLEIPMEKVLKIRTQKSNGCNCKGGCC